MGSLFLDETLNYQMYLNMLGDIMNPVILFKNYKFI